MDKQNAGACALSAFQETVVNIVHQGQEAFMGSIGHCRINILSCRALGKGDNIFAHDVKIPE